MSRRSPAPGSQTARDCNHGMRGSLDVRNQRAVANVEREEVRVNMLIASLPRIVFDDAGYADFQPEGNEQLESLELAADRFNWGVEEYASTGVYKVLCKVKNTAYLKRQHDAECIELVPRLYFQRGPNGMMAICDDPERNEDLRHGLDLLAKRYGWTVNHANRKAVKQAA